MRFEGLLSREGTFWIAEIPLLEAITQGKTRKEALLMIEDWISTMVNDPELTVRSYLVEARRFEIEGSDPAQMTALLLRRRREASGSTLSEVARRLGSSSRNAYARYEQGKAVPTIETLDRLLKAASPGADFVIREATKFDV